MLTKVRLILRLMVALFLSFKTIRNALCDISAGRVWVWKFQQKENSLKILWKFSVLRLNYLPKAYRLVKPVFSRREELDCAILFELTNGCSILFKLANDSSILLELTNGCSILFELTNGSSILRSVFFENWCHRIAVTFWFSRTCTSKPYCGDSCL